eukprot:2040252-Pleurochrysis_carterae.AAC.1
MPDRQWGRRGEGEACARPSAPRPPGSAARLGGAAQPGGAPGTDVPRCHPTARLRRAPPGARRSGARRDGGATRRRPTA